VILRIVLVRVLSNFELSSSQAAQVASSSASPTFTLSAKITWAEEAPVARETMGEGGGALIIETRAWSSRCITADTRLARSRAIVLTQRGGIEREREREREERAKMERGRIPRKHFRGAIDSQAGLWVEPSRSNRPQSSPNPRLTRHCTGEKNPRAAHGPLIADLETIRSSLASSPVSLSARIERGAGDN